MLRSKNELCIALTPAALTEIRMIADKEQRPLAAVGRALIEEALRAKGRNIPNYRPYEALRKRRIEDAVSDRAQVA